MKLVGREDRRWQNRAHFFGVTAQAMRHILVDYARARHAVKRGGEARAVSLDEAALVTKDQASEVVALDDALNRLSELAPRQGRVVELRYFGGLSVEETAEVLKISIHSRAELTNQPPESTSSLATSNRLGLLLLLPLSVLCCILEQAG